MTKRKNVPSDRYEDEDNDDDEEYDEKNPPGYISDPYEAWGMDRPEPGEDDPFEGWGNE